MPTLIVDQIFRKTERIRLIALKSTSGEALAGFDAGSHLPVIVPGLDDPRSYSLIDFDGTAEALQPQSRYMIAVLLDDNSSGGSRHMHELLVGDALETKAPINHFPLLQDDASPVLIAGGIGITPLISMAAALRERGQAFDLHYSGRSREHLAFLPELNPIAGGGLRLHFDNAGTKLVIADVLCCTDRKRPLYVCGPTGMIDAVTAEATRLGWDKGNIHFEHFSAASPRGGDEGFEVEMKASQRTLFVPANKTILDVAIENGIDVMYDCRRGDCGICQVNVLAGEPDHRDYILSDSEKRANTVMQICISRAKSNRLVLDL